MTATTTTAAPFAAARTDRTGTRPSLVRTGALAAAIAAVAATAVVVAAEAIGVPMVAGPRNADAGSEIPLVAFALSTLSFSGVGLALAALLRRVARRPARTFVVTTLVLTLASFWGPISTGHATTATRVVLALTHVVAAAIVIPAVAARLPQRSARRA